MPAAAVRLAGLLLLCGSAALAAPPAPAVEGRVLKDIWEAAHLEGAHVGHIHRTFRELKFGDRLVVEGVVEMDLALTRFGQPVRLQSTQATHENAVGRLRGFILQEGVGEQRLFRKGQVTGKELAWTVQVGSKPATLRRLPWTEAALGLYAQEQLLPQRPPGAEPAFTYERFEPVFDTVLPVEVSVGAEEETALLGGLRKKLRKATCRLDPKQTQDAPPEFLWIDEAGEAWKRQIRLPLLGELVAYRCTQAVAQKRGGAVALDIGKAQLIPVAKPLNRPQDARAITYRATLTEVGDVAAAFPADERQSVRVLGLDTVEIKVEGLRRPPGYAVGQPLNSPRPPAEFLQSNAFITSDDPTVRRLATQAAGVEADPWRKAVRIESWVRQNMRGFANTEGFATAAEVARTLSGDCKGHAILAAALCRAQGVPSRIAVGLVYVPRERAFGFHMWFEVWVDGSWYALDPTLGQGRVAAEHIKVLDHSLNGEQSFAPLLPIARLVGKLKLEIVAVETAPGGGLR